MTKNLVNKILLLAFMLVMMGLARAQDPQVSWGYSYGTTLDVTSADIITDSNGNVISLGSFDGTIDFDPGAGTNSITSVGRSPFIQKLNSAGDHVWTSAFLTSAVCTCYPTSLAIDSEDNIYVGGYFDGSMDFDPSGSTSSLTATGGKDGYVVKLNSSGALVWAVQITSTSNMQVNAVEVDASNNVFIGGDYTGTIDLNTGSGTNNRASLGGDDIFLIKLNSAGTYQWGYGAGTSQGNDQLNDMAINGDGDLFLAGSLFLTSNSFYTLGGSFSALMQSRGGEDASLLKVDGATGEIMSGYTAGGSSSDRANSVDTDASDNIYVGGSFQSSAVLAFTTNSGSRTSSGGFDAFITKISSANFFQWVTNVGSSGTETINKLAVSNGSIYSVGSLNGSIDFDTSSGTKILSGSSDSFIWQIDTDANYEWAGVYAGSNAASLSDIAVNGSSFYGIGTFDTNVDIDPTSGTQFLTNPSTSSDDLYHLKMSTNNDPTDISLSSSNVNENSSINTTVGTLSTTDSDAGDSHTYSLVSGTGDTDNGSFNISGSSLRLSIVPDHETKSSYSVRIQTSDGNGGVYSEAFAITVNDVNEAPSDVSISPDNIDENTTGSVGSFSVTDEDDGDSHTISLVAGKGDTHNESFTISKGSLSLTRSFSHESNASLSIRVRAEDAGALSFEKELTITINDVAEAPTNISLTSNNIQENNAINAVVGNISTTDQDAGESYTYSLVAGSGDTDNGSFNINGNQLRASSSFDFETKSSYSVRLQTNDGNGGLFAKQFTINITDASEAPTDLALDNTSIQENNAVNDVIGNLSTTDDDAGETYTYSLVSGTGDADNSSFNINGGELRASSSFDFETKNSYSVRVQTNDGNGGLFAKQLTINITNASEAPTDLALDNNSIQENNAVDDVIGTLSTTDEDAGETYTYSLVAGTGDNDNASFNINGDELRASGNFDFETKNSYSVRVQTNDGNGGLFAKAFTINVSNESETPTDVALDNTSIQENNAVNDIVGNLSTTDEDAGETYTYSLVAGIGDTDNASFNINGGQLRASSSFDFETKSSYAIRIQTNDGNGGLLAKEFTITVSNESETPTDISLDNATIAENTIDIVGNLSTTDEDAGETYTYSLVAGTGDDDNVSFNISGDRLRASSVFDFETKSSYTVRIQTNDGNGGLFAKAFTITITDGPDAPTDINLSSPSIAENEAPNSIVAALLVTDADASDSHTYELISGTGDTDNDAFTITDIVALRAKNSLDFETKNSYSIRVRVTDSDGLTFDKALSIAVLDANDDPTDFSINSNEIVENNSINDVIGTLSSIDQDVSDTHTYSLVAGTGDTDNSSFNINGDELRASSSFDFETKNNYSVRVQTNDGNGGLFAKQLTINVTDASEAPTDLALDNNTIQENNVINAVIGMLSTTDVDAGETYVYTLVNGTGDTDNASFNINGDELRASSSFDFETKSSYSVRVQTNDGNGGLFAKQLTINITDVSEAPTDLALDNNTIQENNAINAVIGMLSTTDVDAGETHTYSLVAGTGDDDNASFNINGDELRASSSFDFETKNSYSVRVQTNDGNGGLFAKQLTISVADASEAPTDLALGNNTIQENNAVNAVIGMLSTTDVDAGETYTYTLVVGTGDTDNASFNINGDELRASSSFDFETKNNYSVRIQTNDGNGGLFSKQLTIAITNQSEAPTGIVLSTSDIDESAPVGTTVGMLSTTDVDAGETYTYTLVTGIGDTDNASFSISGNELQSDEIFDFETKTSYSVRIQTNDGNGGIHQQAFSISINDLPPGLTGVGITSNSVDENLAAGTIVGNLFALGDEISGVNFTFSLVAGTGDSGNGSFTISGDQLITASTFDFETINQFSIRVNANDGAGSMIDQVITIDINDANDAPTDVMLSASTIDENNEANDIIGSLTSTDEDASDVHSYILVSGAGDTDNGLFNISGSELRASSVFNFENGNTYSVRVQTNDGNGGTYEESFTIAINDVSEAPTDLTLSASVIDENNSINDLIGTLTSTDEDAGESHTYSLVAGEGDTDNASFLIVGDELRAGVSFDFEAASSFNVRVQTDDGNGGLFEKSFTITINDVNEAPTDISLSGNSIEESVASGTFIGSFSSTDEDAAQTFNYALVSGTGDTDNVSFTISGGDLLSAEIFDFESQNSYSIRVQTSDGNGGTFEKVFTISITDLPAQITSITLGANTIDENEASGSPIGTFATFGEDLSGSFTYSLEAGAGDDDNASFTISGDQLLTSASFNFEQKASYSILVMSDDGSQTETQVFSISVNDVAEAPTDIALSGNTIIENNDVDAVIGTLSTTDEDAGETYTFSLVAGAGDTDNASFTISENELRASSSFDFETKSSYSVRIQTNDGNGGLFEESFTVTIINENEAVIVANAIEDQVMAEGFTSSTIDLTNVFVDTDGDAITYSTNSSNTDVVTVDHSGTTLTLTEVGLGTSTITVTANDGNGASISDEFSITVNNVNDAPVVTNAIVDQNQNEGFGSLELDLSTTFSDEDGDALTLSAVSSDESIVTVSISGSLLTISEIGNGSSTITVTANDGNGGTVSDEFLMTVNNVNDAPVVVTAIEDQSQDEGFGSLELDLSATFSDEDGDALTLSTVSSDESIVTVSISGTMLTISEIGNGASTITVTANDGNGGSVSDEFLMTVNNVNDAPVVANAIVDQNQNEGFGSIELDLSATFSDEDGDALTLSATSSDETVVTTSISGSILTITEVGNGMSTITVTANDGNGGSVSDDFTMKVIAAPNNAPTVANAIADASEQEGFGSMTIDLTNTFVDSDGDALTLSVVSSDETVVTGSISNNTLTLTEVGLGTSTITVTADDGNGGSVTDEFTFTIIEVPLGLEDEINLSIYPNPVTSYLNIESEKEIRVQLTDLNGRTLKNNQGKNVQMNVESLPKGVYILMVSEGEETIKRRIIKTN